MHVSFLDRSKYPVFLRVFTSSFISGIWKFDGGSLCVSGTMLRAAFLLLAASLAVSLARPRLKPLSTDLVNYINKVNTTWKVSLFISSSNCLTVFVSISWNKVSLLSRRPGTTSITWTTAMSGGCAAPCWRDLNCQSCECQSCQFQ